MPTPTTISPVPPAARSVRRQACWLFVSLALALFLTLEGHINTPDAQVMFRVSQALLERGDVAIQPLRGLEQFGGRYGAGALKDRFYSWFGLGPSLLQLPTLALGELLLPVTSASETGLFHAFHARLDALNQEPAAAVKYERASWSDTSPANFPEAFLIYFASMTNVWVTAAIGVMMFLLGINLGYGARAGCAAGVATCFLTPFWHYSGELFAEPAFALDLLVFFWLARTSRAYAAGTALGVLALLKTANLIVLPWAGLYLLVLGRRHCQTPAAWWRWLWHLAAGACGPLAVIAGYNFLRFGSVLESGYGAQATQWTTPVLTGLYGLLVGPGRGLLWYCPLLVLSILQFRAFWRRCRAEACFLGATSLTFLVVYANWWGWEGGWCWAPRYILPAVPLALLPALGWAEGWRARSPRARTLVVALAALSGLIAFSGVLVSYNPYALWLRATYAHDVAAWQAAGNASYYDLMNFRWQFAPFWRYFAFPVRQWPVLLTAFAYPGLILGLNLAALALLPWSLWRLRAALAEPESPVQTS